MSDSEPEISVEETSQVPQSSTPKKLGCMKIFLLLCLLGVTGLLIGVFVIDKMNAGGKIKRKIRSVASRFVDEPRTPRPPPTAKPQVKVVEKIVEVPVEKVVYKEKIVEVEVLPPLPSKYISWKKIDTAKMWNGIGVVNSVESPQGETASLERVKEDAFQIEMKVSFKVPTPGTTMGELERINPHLPKALPGLGALVDGSSNVSPFYHKLYENKTARIQQKTTRFDQLLSVHNLYDTETVLEIENPETSQTALLIQSDMDVVSDGSDGDRWPFLDNYVSMSKYYQPFTSYGWGKRTRTPNPLLARWGGRIQKAQRAIRGKRT